MEDIREKLKIIKDKTKELEVNKEILNSIVDVIEGLTDRVEEVIVNQEAMEENIKFMDTDLSGIQEELFEEVSFEDLEEIEEEYREVHCQNCNKPIFMEKSLLENGKTIKCPFCGENAI